MHTKAFHTFRENVSQLLGHINALDLYLQVSRERIAEWKKEKKDQAEHIVIQAPGITYDNLQEYQEIFGVVTLKLSEADRLISFVMLTTCRNALVALIAVAECYLEDLCVWIFETKLDVFKSNKELKLTHKEVIELGNYQAVLDIVLNRVLSDLTRNNIADSFEELLVNKCGWDIDDLRDNLILFKDISATRNIIVHNQSRVNEIFLSMVSEPDKYTMNQEIIISPQELKQFTYTVVGLLRDLDKIAFSKCES